MWNVEIYLKKNKKRILTADISILEKYINKIHVNNTLESGK